MFLYTKKGIYHRQRKEGSGDIVRGLDNGDFAVLVMADGVSSCKYGAEGAGIVSSCAMDYVYKQYSIFHFLPKEWPVFMLNLLKKQLNTVAENNNDLCEEYSTTLMVLVIDRVRGIMHYCNIGDGILMAIGEKKCPLICMPQGGESGCPVITTKGIEKKMISGEMNLDDVNSVMMCSDGTWEMMYNHNILKPEIKEILLRKNYVEFKEYIKEAHNTDDCSFAFVDVRRAA